MTLLDTVLENYPQAVLMTSFMFVSLEYERIRIFLKNNLSSLFTYGSDEQITSHDKNEGKSTQFWVLDFEEYGAVVAIFAITTVFTLVFVVRT